MNRRTAVSYTHLDVYKRQQEYEANRLTTGCNVLLYGVPGSGKSWTIEHEYCKPGCVVERLVFHPDYTYSDFIGQILPAVAEDGQVSYKFTPGPFTNILREAYNHPGTESVSYTHLNHLPPKDSRGPQSSLSKLPALCWQKRQRETLPFSF